jgi:hypothetical protein
MSTDEMPRMRPTGSHPPQIIRTGGIVPSTRPLGGEIVPEIRPALGVTVDPVTAPIPVTQYEDTPRPKLFRSGERMPPRGAPLILPPPDADSFFELKPAPEETARSTKKMLRRRRRAALVAFVAIAASVLLVGQIVRGTDRHTVTTIAPAASALPPADLPGPVLGRPTAAAETSSGPASDKASASASAKSKAARTRAADQPPADTSNDAPTRIAGTIGSFTFASGYGPVLGTSGTLRRFKVAVEKSLHQGNGGDFADEIDRTLGDSRSWIAGRQFRLQRVPSAAASEFTIYLASARTSTKLCGAGGLSTDGFSSCQLPGQVVINADRWEDAVPHYDAPLETYRAYAVNHEVGHQLGHGHEACPGKGRAAPVMQQQTYGLRGCVANAWPYIDGKRYTGAPMP